ncbi:hypothetical protein [Parvularcula sp. IMCC14364]|uniref:hypothetical protein n=1 Tax=Parvularcula sp. IMCC14364 TaxID=3067902 RepID=UPI002740C809|nr:hypothetical protein [Parvularcula sp. IMCC14364]
MLGIFLAILALAVIAGIRVGPDHEHHKPRVRTGSLLMLASGVAAMMTISTLLVVLGHLPQTDVGGLAKTYRMKLAQHTPDKVLIVVDGGSMAARGLDGEMVSKELTSKGVENTLIQLTFMGANHTERNFLNEYLLENLPRDHRKNIINSQIVFLLEVYSGYDLNPLAKAHENVKAQRVLDYLSPERARQAYKSITENQDGMSRAVAPFTPEKIRRNREIDADVKWATGLRKMEIFLFETGLSNFLRIGILSRRDTMSATRGVYGYRPIKAQREFDFVPTESVLDYFSQQAPEADFARNRLIEERTPRFVRAWGDDNSARVIYFSTPTISADEVIHLNGVCSMVRARNCLTYDDPSLLASLNDKKYWRDTIHLTSEGAPVFSAWFADELADSLVEGRE